MPSPLDPIIVIQSSVEPIPAIAAAAVDAGWPVWQSDPLGQLLRRLFLERPEVAVVETDTTHGPLLRTLRERRPDLSLIAVSRDNPATELIALAAGAHAWLTSAAGADAIRRTAEALRTSRLRTPHQPVKKSPLARATA